MIENIIEVTKETLVGEVSKMKSDGQRLVTYSCTDIGEGNVDIIYHFDKDEVLTNLRMTAANGSTHSLLQRCLLRSSAHRKRTSGPVCTFLRRSGSRLRT